MQEMLFMAVKNSKASHPPTVASSKALTANCMSVSIAIWWQWTGAGCILKSDAYSGSTVYDALLVKHSEIWCDTFPSDALVQRKMWYALTLAVLSCFSEGGIFTVEWGGIITEIILTVNMPPIKNSPHKTGKSMLFFTFEIPLFIVMSINSQIYMTKPKQAQKTLSENTGKAFSVIMSPFSSKGGAQLRKWLYWRTSGWPGIGTRRWWSKRSPCACSTFVDGFDFWTFGWLRLTGCRFWVSLILLPTTAWQRYGSNV